MSDFKERVLLAMRKQVLFTPHSLEQMNRLERMITPDEIREVVLKGDHMKCFYCNCKGTLKLGTTTYTVNKGGYHLVIDNVPAYVCGQCGEYLFRDAEVRRIQKLISELDDEVALLKAAA